jgi:hypothetical protein
VFGVVGDDARWGLAKSMDAGEGSCVYVPRFTPQRPGRVNARLPDATPKLQHALSLSI